MISGRTTTIIRVFWFQDLSRYLQLMPIILLQRAHSWTYGNYQSCLKLYFFKISQYLPYPFCSCTGCGGKLTGNEGTFVGSVPPGKKHCHWFITAAKDRFLTVVYEDFDVTKSQGRSCRRNYVELKEYFKNGRKVSRGRQCGSKNEGKYRKNILPRWILEYDWMSRTMLYCTPAIKIQNLVKGNSGPRNPSGTGRGR